ncbi:unnamed protein product [Cuscuta europaea]|uniref:Uncharacterized protein n=1 Tax=Cuscuta europaea TaxID=41803 RepID=A0A9P1EP47_CUSEU|nr:unnamed protein product [Cuscuta europaea]
MPSFIRFPSTVQTRPLTDEERAEVECAMRGAAEAMHEAGEIMGEIGRSSDHQSMETWNDDNGVQERTIITNGGRRHRIITRRGPRGQSYQQVIIPDGSNNNRMTCPTFLLFHLLLCGGMVVIFCDIYFVV